MLVCVEEETVAVIHLKSRLSTCSAQKAAHLYIASLRRWKGTVIGSLPLRDSFECNLDMRIDQL